MNEAVGITMKGGTLGRRTLQGFAVFAMLLAPLFCAASPDTLTFHVRPIVVDVQPPNPVASLQALPSSIEGEVGLLWIAPTDIPNVPTKVKSYEVRYATYPYAVAGSTTAWWSLATSTSFPELMNVGSKESFFLEGLVGGKTYYFAIRSQDAVGNWSLLDTSAPQAHAYPKFVRPDPVAGLLAFKDTDTSFHLNWDSVSGGWNEAGVHVGTITVADYVVRQSTSFMGPFNTIAPSGVVVSGLDVYQSGLPTAVQGLEYLRVTARTAAGNESDPALSNILQVTPQGIIGQMAVSVDAALPLSRVYVPSGLMGEMKTSAGDLLLKVAPDADPVMSRDPRTLATYDVSLVSPAQVVDKNFTFSRPAMNVVLQSPAPITEGSVGVLWWNGNVWVKVALGPADVDDINKTVSFRTALPGIYQVRTFQAATDLTLDKNSVFPRIFTPNGDGINDMVYFVIENPNHSAIDGKIYDVSGNEVSDIRPAGAGAPTPDTLSWDGRDRDGRLVPAGVYIYRIKGEGKKMTGTVVVAK